MESSYCSNWTVKDALREIIQNALDTHTKVEFARTDDCWAIKDKGSGLHLSDFLIGRSSKGGDEDTIGQFGEGIKIGALVLARNNRKVAIESLDKKYVFSFQHDNEWGASLLTIDTYDVITDSGTTVFVECSEAEIEEAKSLFLAFKPANVLCNVSKAEFIGKPGQIYVNGLKVTEIESLFGYNFKEQKELVNRDRSAIGYSQIKNSIGDALSLLTNAAVIRHLLEAAEENKIGPVAEFNVDFYPIKKVWLGVIKELWGDRVCISTYNSKANLNALDKGWMVLDFSYNLKRALGNFLPDALFVTTDNKRKRVPIKSLSDEERGFFRKGKDIANWLAEQAGLNVYPISIYANQTEEEKRYNEFGFYRSEKVGVNVNLIKSKDMSKLLGTILHEYAHGTGGNGDYSRGFENDLTDIIAKLGGKLAYLLGYGS